MKRFAQVLAMLLFGLASLAILGWRYEVRSTRPLADEPTWVKTTPMDAFVESARHTAEHAADALVRGDRSEATHALDAAMRALEVAAHGTGRAFDEARHEVRTARVHLQRGQVAEAITRARQAAASLDAVVASWPAAPSAEVLGAYAGATVLDLQGLRIGKVDAVRADEGMLELSLDGWLDVLGFLDLGANLEGSVPAGALLYGEPRTFGGTLVVLPVVRAASGSRA
jgi:hypothetical protein